MLESPSDVSSPELTPPLPLLPLAADLEGTLSACLACPLCQSVASQYTTFECGHSTCLTCFLAKTDSAEGVMPRSKASAPCCDASFNKSSLPSQNDFVLSNVARQFLLWQQGQEDEARSPGSSEPACLSLVDQPFSSRNLPANVKPLLPPPQALALAVLSELECTICVGLICDPVTTPCGHSFCRSCLARTLDHSDRCPVCRAQQPAYASFTRRASNQALASVLKMGFPVLYENQAKDLSEQEALASLNLPIFVSSLSFPTIPTFLHIFEPRYRLMMRRVMQGNKCFGMVLPCECPEGMHAYGTVLQIQNLELLPDGRSLVQAIGVTRFKMLRTGLLDGYLVAEVEIIEDVSAQEELELEELAVTQYKADQEQRRQQRQGSENEEPPLEPEKSTAQHIERCWEFLGLLRSSAAPWLQQKLSDTLGPPPKDPAELSWYMAAVVPVHKQEKVKLLAITSVRTRFRLINHWMDQFAQSGKLTRGCAIM